ncbi:MAG TPA: ABC transporter ATP-binding protein [Gemmataceae bacterium]|nr:ABC transporter ATP-binding protein [Gemmataceae bacterium]
MSASAIIRASGLVKRYVTASTPVEALRGVSLEVRRGERIALLGRSGSGKSTLLNIIGGLDRATAGDILVSGQNLSQLSSNALAQYRLATVGMIFQSFNLILSRTALQNVELPMIFAGGMPRDRLAAARQALEAVGLVNRLDHRPAELSGGEHQRVAIARALVNQPEILLADEPTGNLDSATAAEVLTILMNHVRQHGTTLILVTHDEELAGRCADRVLRLKDGQLIS